MFLFFKTRILKFCIYIGISVYLTFSRENWFQDPSMTFDSFDFIDFSSLFPGNVFVIAAVFLEKNLQNSVANYLIVSLAVADLMVAGLVMPLGALYEVRFLYNTLSMSYQFTQLI